MQKPPLTLCQCSIFALSIAMILLACGSISTDSFFPSIEEGKQNYCSCASLGHDEREWESIGLNVRLLDFAVGYPLKNKVILNIGTDDTIYFLNLGAAVHTVDGNGFDMQNLRSAVRSIPNHAFSAYQQNLEDFHNSLCLFKHFGVSVDLSNVTTCRDLGLHYPLKEIPELNRLLHAGLDLLHVKCNGCEYALLFYFISSGLVERVARINAAVHTFAGYEKLHCQLHRALMRTHVPIYCTGVWQGWALRGTEWQTTGHLQPAASAAASIPALVAPPPACPPNVLLLGDSVDRYVVRDLCARRNGTVEDWSNAMFMYKAKEPASGSAACRLPGGGALAHLHLFGSNATGPYRDNIAASWFDPLVDTPARICKGLEVFAQRVGRPALVVFQVLMWDLLGYRKQAWGSDDDKVAAYRAAVDARLRDVRRCAPLGAALAVRTVPNAAWGGRLMPLFNAALRDAAHAAGLPVVDFDALMAGWAAAAGPGDADMFRDGYHPTEPYCARFADHVLALAAANASCPAQAPLNTNKE